MKSVRAVIFGIRNLILRNAPDSNEGEIDAKSAHEFGQLIQLIRHRNIQPVLFANTAWVSSDGKSMDVKLREQWGDFPVYIANERGMPKKPTADAMHALLTELQL